MKKLALVTLIFTVLVFLFAVSTFAETVAEKQQDGSFLIKERTEKTLASIPPLPKGISFDEKVVLQFYTGELPGVVVKRKKEKKIVSLFPPTAITKAQSDVRIELVNGKWNTKVLPLKDEVKERDNFMLWFLVVVCSGILIVSVLNRLYDDSLNWLLFLYLLLSVTVFAASVAGDNALIGVIIIGILSVFFSCNKKTFFADVIAATIVGAGASAFVHEGDTGVIRQYLLFLVIVEIVSFAIATGVKKIFDNHKTRKFAASVPGEIS